jgi:predicted DNA-binding helix-hairpin-helix protein
MLSEDLIKKLDILSEDAQYDLACACGGKNPKEHRRRSLDGRWLYPVPLTRGGYGIILKTLLSNACTSDCRYCPLRHDGNGVRRCMLSPDEIARAFLAYDRRLPLLGLFLSSGIIGNADRTMERLTDTAAILRHKYRYRGYIHLKIIPGASPAAIRRSLQLASAVSLNIETPGAKHFARLSQYKNYERDIIAPLKLMAAETARGAEFARVKCSTQFIVGAADESDREIVRYMDGIYKRLQFQRVYFSAYQGGLGHPGIPGEKRFDLSPHDCLTREHRLYQVDFLLRQYHFEASDIVYGEQGNLDLGRDPKEQWAISHPAFFPVKINSGEREALLRVPGLGPVSVKRILSRRRQGRIRALSDLGLRGKLAAKAQPYLDFS